MSTLPLPLRHRRFLAAPRRSCRQASRGWASLLVGLAAVLLWPTLVWAQVLYTGPNLPSKPAPANSIGVENSFYLDQTTGNIWGPKTLGSWPPIPNTLLSGGATFYARNFPSASGALCTWDSTHDVGPCINSAIAAASSAPGGDVTLPCGIFGFSTTIVNHTTGVRLRGCGLGLPRNPITSALASTSTILKWIGSTAPLGVDLEPPDGNSSMASAGIEGIWIDGQSQLTTILRIASVSYSNFQVGVMNRLNTGVGMDLSTLAGAVASLGSQHNTGSFFEITPNTTAGIGILFRQDPGSVLDWSASNLTEVYANETGGTGTPIEFVTGDSNIINQCFTFGNTPSLVANSTDTLPAGLTNGTAAMTHAWRANVIIDHLCPIIVHGLMSGATFTATSVAGTEGPTTIPITTAASSRFLVPLNVTSTTGVAAFENINVTGGWAAGVPPNSFIESVGSSTVLNLGQRLIFNVANGLSGTVSWGAVPGQAFNGAYTLTYNASESGYDLTAPAGGGDSQTGIQPVNGTLTFTDFVIPWTTGTPVNGDTWTITLPAVTPDTLMFYHTNTENVIPYPFFEVNGPRTGGCYGSDFTYPCAFFAEGQGVSMGALSESNVAANGGMVLNAFASAAQAPRTVVIGGGLNFTQDGTKDSVVVGGRANVINSPAFNDVAIGGTNNVQGGTNTTALASNNGNDFNRVGLDFHGAGVCNNAIAAGDGSCQGFHTVLAGVGAGGAAIRLTSNLLAAGATNCLNLTQPETSAGFTATITLQSQGATGATAREAWLNWSMLLYRDATNASTTLAAATTPTPLGSATGSISATADTTNGCLNLTVTPPAGGTWTAVANISGSEGR